MRTVQLFGQRILLKYVNFIKSLDQFNEIKERKTISGHRKREQITLKERKTANMHVSTLVSVAGYSHPS